MRRRLLTTGMLGTLVAVAITVSLNAQGADPVPAVPAAANHPGHTVPSMRAQVGLARADVVSVVKVKRGDRVKKGDVLLVLDDREELVKLQIYEAAANNDIEIQAAIARHDTAKVELERVKLMSQRNVAAAQELAKAELEEKVSGLEIEAARVKHAQEVLQAELQRKVLERMRIVAPFDGVVEDIDTDPGELVDPNKFAMILVKNDPLWVEVYLPTSISLKMQDMEKKQGKAQTLKVQYVGTNRPAQDAPVIFYSPEADPSADVQLVRLELANPDGLPSGLQVEVVTPDMGQQPAAAAVAAP